MRITKEQLKQIIKEELEVVMEESDDSPWAVVDEIVERHLPNFSVELAVNELIDYTADQFAEYAYWAQEQGWTNSKAEFVNYIEKDMQDAENRGYRDY